MIGAASEDIMGNQPFADDRIRVFASASSWIEGAAIDQLKLASTRRGAVALAGMPDLHPGHKGPVGCALLTEGVVHPDIIGTDIGCGMTMWRLGGHVRKLRVDRAVKALECLDEDWTEVAEARGRAAGLEGLDDYLHALGTVGGGNHFVELQAVDKVVDPVLADGIRAGDLYLLVHSGSRALGPAIYERHACGVVGLDLDKGGTEYIADHDAAVAFASLNRNLLAERASDLLGMEGTPWLDVPHNHVEVQGNLVLHRKGAAPSDRGIVPVPGSRGAMTYLVDPVPGVEGALYSIAHGAGRKRDRASMVARVKSSTKEWKERPNPVGNRVICADRKLEAEESPEAYKDIRRVVADLEEHGMAKVAAIMRPVVTFKTTGRRHDD